MLRERIARTTAGGSAAAAAATAQLSQAHAACISAFGKQGLLIGFNFLLLSFLSFLRRLQDGSLEGIKAERVCVCITWQARV